MSASPAQQDTIQRAWTLLQEKQPIPDVLALVEPITEGQPQFAQAQHVRGACALHQGDAARAKALLIDAIRHGEQTSEVWLNLAASASATGWPDDALAMLLGLLKRISTPKLVAFSNQLLGVLGFKIKAQAPAKDTTFTKVVVPLLGLLLERGAMDAAIAIENMLYERYVKATETEEHFAWCMNQVAPLFTKAAHALRDRLPPLPFPALIPPYRVGFFIHSATMLAHIEMILTALKGYRMLDDQPFEPTIYCFSGKSLAMERAFADLGVRVVMLNELFPDTKDSHWRRLLCLRELLSKEGVHELVWVSLVTMLPLAFGLRLAPVQTWFAMKYKTFSNEDIDGYVTQTRLTRFSTLCGRRWRTAMNGLDNWYDADAEAPAAVIREPLKDHVILMTLARTEKMMDPGYLWAVTSLLKAHPETFFIWAGREQNPAVVKAFQEAGVLARTRFVGWVNTHVYAQVADIFLDTFPFPCGLTLSQTMAAGKPIVLYDSPESAQTGLWMFIKPVLVDGEGTDELRAELRTDLGDDTNPLIPVASTPEEYVRHASRLITDEHARAASGDACRRVIARYFSDPKAMGASLSQHFVELIEERAASAG
jgi:hypothetical protein